jgi:hypothetical protein
VSDANPDATAGSAEGSDAAARDSGRSADASTASGSDAATADSTAARIRRGVNYAALAGLCLLALVAGIGFYTAVLSTISLWVAPEYVSAFRALFNLVVLLLAGLGVSIQLRRLR